MQGAPVDPDFEYRTKVLQFSLVDPQNPTTSWFTTSRPDTIIAYLAFVSTCMTAFGRKRYIGKTTIESGKTSLLLDPGNTKEFVLFMARPGEYMNLVKDNEDETQESVAELHSSKVSELKKVHGDNVGAMIEFYVSLFGSRTKS